VKVKGDHGEESIVLVKALTEKEQLGKWSEVNNRMPLAEASL